MGDAVESLQLAAQELRELFEIGGAGAREIERNHRGLDAARRRDRIVGRFELFLLASEEGHGRASRRARERDRASQPLARAGDEDGAALEEALRRLVTTRAFDDVRACIHRQAARKWRTTALAAARPLRTADSSVAG
jgi:hypothetical protein